jgi:pyrrolidone-carboxylate peptidase
MSILIVGFEAFGSLEVNPSAEIANLGRRPD